MQDFSSAVGGVPPAVISAISAFFVAFASFLVTLISKEQKTSEFRQAWIDALREDLSQYVSLNLEIVNYYVNSKKDQPNHSEADQPNHLETFYKERIEELIEIEALRHRILLRLNMKEEKHIELANLIEKINNYGDHERRNEPKKIKELSSSIINLSQEILKTEWSRVKRGEWTFFSQNGFLFLS
jgi:hypothetical protein